MPRYKLTIEYDGSGFAGWQRQQEKLSVQEVLENAISLFCGEKVEAIAAGRTDAGVHATAQVVHIDLSVDHPPRTVEHAINFHLMPHLVSVLTAEKVSNDFHARFSATGRRYLYRIINRSSRLALDAGRAWRVFEKLDTDVMQEAAQQLLGQHDFTSFRDTQCQAKSALKTLDRLDVVRHGAEIRIHAEARSFLHHQVRIMVGTLMEVGKGRRKPSDMKAILEAKDRSAAGQTAPPEGLYLVGVRYS